MNFCLLEHVDALKAPQLKAFVIAHNDELTRISDIPNRDKLGECKANPPLMNSILMAFNCQRKPNLLEGKQPHSAEELAVYDNADKSIADDFNVTVVRIGGDNSVLHGNLLSDPLWRSNVSRLLNVADPGEVGHESLEKANLLVKLLRARFKRHAKTRIKQKSKHAH